ncbi:hypothetical protein VUR80DRAFT_7650 [Thermomyces stellatus]
MASGPACFCRSVLSSTPRLRAAFSTSAPLQAGHNKWSKIRHDKGAADRKRGAQNIILARAITHASRKGGPDKNDNPALAAAIAAAKAANVTNDFIARAIARGQARTLNTSGLEKVTVEAVMPGNVALLLDVETDSRLRSLQDLNALIRKSGGKPGSTLFYFEHCGRISVKLDGGRQGDDVVSAVIDEEGVLDFDVEDAEVTVWTEAGETGRLAGLVKEKCGVDADADLMWRAKGDMGVTLDSDVAARDLASFLAALHEFPEVMGSYINAVKGSISDERWANVQDNLIAP